MTKEFANTTTKAVRANVKRMAESAVGAGVPAAGSAGSVPVVVGDPVGDPVVGDPVGDPVVGDPVVGDPVVGDPVVGATKKMVIIRSHIGLSLQLLDADIILI